MKKLISYSKSLMMTTGYKSHTNELAHPFASSECFEHFQRFILSCPSTLLSISNILSLSHIPNSNFDLIKRLTQTENQKQWQITCGQIPELCDHKQSNPEHAGERSNGH